MRKIVYDKKEIQEIFDREYAKKVGIPQAIKEIHNDDMKEKLYDIWLFFNVNFPQLMHNNEPMKKKTLNHHLYRYTVISFFYDMGGIENVIDWFSDKQLLDIFPKSTMEDFVKKHKLEGMTNE